MSEQETLGPCFCCGCGGGDLLACGEHFICYICDGRGHSEDHYEDCDVFKEFQVWRKSRAEQAAAGGRDG